MIRGILCYSELSDLPNQLFRSGGEASPRRDGRSVRPAGKGEALGYEQHTNGLIEPEPDNKRRYVLVDTGDRLRAARISKRFELAPDGEGARRLLEAALVTVNTWSPLPNSRRWH